MMHVPLRVGSLQPMHMYKVLAAFHGRNKHFKEVISTPSDCFVELTLPPPARPPGGSIKVSSCPELKLVTSHDRLGSQSIRPSLREIIGALWWCGWLVVPSHFFHATSLLQSYTHASKALMQVMLLFLNLVFHRVNITLHSSLAAFHGTMYHTSVLIN